MSNSIAQMLNAARRATAANDDSAALVARQSIARSTLRSMQDELRKPLTTAASEARLVLESLAEGRWNSTVRALRGLALKNGTKATYYLTLASKLEAVIPNGLDIY